MKPAAKKTTPTAQAQPSRRTLPLVLLATVLLGGGLLFILQSSALVAPAVSADSAIGRTVVEPTDRPEPVPEVASAAPPSHGVHFTADANLATQALALVGSDPTAEQYWIRSINDPGLAPVVRKNLIEDLNETGLSATPAVSDLPVIARRLQLIDQLAPTAMDATNTAAFAEARKDLVNLITRLASQAAPQP